MGHQKTNSIPTKNKIFYMQKIQLDILYIMVYQKNLKYQTKGELEQINDDEGLSSTGIFKRDTNNHVLSIMNKLHKKERKQGLR